MNDELSNRKALIHYRMERAHETLSSAQVLYQQGQDSASIVNRAYYAMFYAALALLATIEQETSKHSGVISLFDKHFIKPGILSKEMGKILHRAFDMRHTGDYEEQIELTQEQAQQILESAIKFVNSIEEKLSDQQ